MKKVIVKCFPALVKYKQILDLILETNQLNPTNINLLFSGNKLFASTRDPRGLGLLRNKGTGQKNIKTFWRTCITLFDPEIMLDIGANYGEVLLDAYYPDSVKSIIGIEANPIVYEYLKKSVATHKVSQRIVTYNNLAGSNDDDEMIFYIDQKSSGRSTALKGNFVKDPLEVRVKSLRADNIVNSVSTDGTLVFKIDVEGFEPFVLEGMTDIFNGERDAIGCIEFNLTSLEKNEIDKQKYFFFLNKYFSIGLLGENAEILAVHKLNEEIIRSHFENRYCEGDIILFSNETLRQDYIDTLK